jgi:glucose 1-dehydrogenase
VVVNYVAHPEEAERVAKLIRDAGSKAIALRADVSKEDDVQAMFAAMLQEFGRSISWSTTPGCNRMRRSRK